ncbi:hypothetical protein [Bailinhaonella thermotolerans]|uniref:Secreted protein n=1 Tax=Bailinhaonella thermotolerans TaxID=1070861 RepID=A0A3A4BGZ1_9ACTN|nr:hypothetical protein [Bailinhaonella thermotolerans]RJL34022.1 hypothetical protein D5H75_05760 [Bailinhaonella thermotolerans]
MRRLITGALAAAATGAALFTASAPALAATAPASAAGTVAGAAAPWRLYAVYSTEAECGRIGHYLVNSDRYDNYECSRTLRGWELWVQ